MSADIVAIGRLIASDNYEHCTAEPLFLVERKRRVYGFDPRFTEEVAWLDGEEVEAATDGETFKRLEEGHERGDDEPDGWTRTGFVDRWEFVTVCFTKQAAEAYIEDQKHNLGEARVYVDSAVRNPEMKAIRRHLVHLYDEHQRAEVAP